MHLKSNCFVVVALFSIVSLYLLNCPNLLAAQDAIVISEEAVIYSDLQMTSPVGYVAKGKKIRVGDIPRNNAQLYPIVVAGRIGYIRVLDVSTEKERIDAPVLTAERFRKTIKKTPESKFSFSYLNFSSIINATKVNDETKNGDLLSWNGISAKGEALIFNKTEIQFVVNYLTTSTNDESYKILEVGTGATYRFLSTKRFLAKLEAQFLGIPYSSYSIGNDFRINSYGFSFGGGPNLTYFFKSGAGIELFGHLYRTQLLGFDLPEPYQNTAVSFTGARVGLGFNVTF
jgi:hypothetical protein